MTVPRPAIDTATTGFFTNCTTPALTSSAILAGFARSARASTVLASCSRATSMSCLILSGSRSATSAPSIALLSWGITLEQPRDRHTTAVVHRPTEGTFTHANDPSPGGGRQGARLQPDRRRRQDRQAQ